MAQLSSVVKETPSARWNLLLADNMHVVELVHGTISGKRVITVNGKEIYRKNWMIALVGFQEFKIGEKKIILSIEPNGMNFEYTLYVNGKPLDKFVQSMKKSLIVWTPELGKVKHRVTLDKITLEIYVDGILLDVESEFSDEGTEVYFSIGDEPVLLKTYSSGVSRKGLIYELFVGEDGISIPIQHE
ncbi:Fas apoptotic inhibitory molecule 1-like [Oopsacas minuta]|uniref:Fas apoptotic inhibitory molecule 1-like n=1 Tax=Oopsacas minuta TaxID=111878 RepID=A0AAV7KJB6_9METZ|nr:Fas apoptotic inhibitory molecule 1-like [Oopsacas minuta]